MKSPINYYYLVLSILVNLLLIFICSERGAAIAALAETITEWALLWDSGVPRNFVRRWGSTNSIEDRGQREQGSGGSCNLVQEISLHTVNFS
jgi:hypothetical protein